MLEACKISELTRSSEHHLFFCDCGECPGPTALENILEDVFADNAIEYITFKEWISTDRCKLVTTVKSSEEFIKSLLEKFLLLLRHSFIATQQAMFLKELKCNLQSSEFVVLSNFAENYSFVLQDEAHGFHWNNAQASIRNL
jgi:predicted metal-binding protein